MPDIDKSDELASQVLDAINNEYKLNIIGGNSKQFYGHLAQGVSVSTKEHSGISNYEPSELVITARAGTSLSEIESTLAEKNQSLIFEPPHFGATATLGGTIAAGIDGPSRPWTGAIKDAVLGVKIINGRGEILHFGGEVMKNVAGYDVSRLMVGSMGTLGILLEVSLKVLPVPKKTMTLVFETAIDKAVQTCSKINNQCLPVSAMLYHDEKLYIRLSGNESSVDSAIAHLGGELHDEINFWSSIKEHSHSFFRQAGTLWRISVPPATLPIELPGDWLIDWGGAQRWLISDMDANIIREQTEAMHGHATLFRNINNDIDVFHPLTPVQKHLHEMVKNAFDPQGLFNPGRLYKYL